MHASYKVLEKWIFLQLDAVPSFAVICPLQLLALAATSLSAAPFFPCGDISCFADFSTGKLSAGAYKVGVTQPNGSVTEASRTYGRLLLN